MSTLHFSAVTGMTQVPHERLPGPVRRRLTPNLFAIAFGLAGVAQAWTTASILFGVPAAIGDLLWIVVAVVWAVITPAYLYNVVTTGRLRGELLDPVFAPFVALGTIVPMLLGTALAGHARDAGVTVFAISLVLTVATGAALIGQWIVSDLSLAQWHPGYFLPTVAGGYLAAAAGAQLGYAPLGRIMFGYATVSWLVLGSILLARLFVQPMLPVVLRPTMAIEMAPAAVGGTAWFELNGAHADSLALGLAGYGVLMVLVQLRLIPLYRRVPFGLTWWAFAFSSAAVFVNALHWLSVENAAHGTAFGYLLLALVSAPIAVLAARTAVGLARGTFLPAPVPISSPPSSPAISPAPERITS